MLSFVGICDPWEMRREGGVADFACRLNAEERKRERRRDFPEFSESQKRHGRRGDAHAILSKLEGRAPRKFLPKSDYRPEKKVYLEGILLQPDKLRLFFMPPITGVASRVYMVLFWHHKRDD